MDPSPPRPDAGGDRRRRAPRGQAVGRLPRVRRRAGPVLALVLMVLVTGGPVQAVAVPAALVAPESGHGAKHRAVAALPDPASPSPLGFRSPVGGAPVVVTSFAPPALRYGAGHRGVDLAVAAGTPIRAAGAGTVVFAGRLADRPVVSIEHDGGLRTTYEPVEPSVVRGARVAAGDVIGTLVAGHPSCPGMDCLHWGARLPDRVYLDPLLLIGSWPVRLWPWDDP